MKVEIGQVWRHEPSGDVRTVVAILPYRVRTGFDPGNFERDYGITHIAVMTDNPDDRRDSSDMELSPDGEPFYRRTWQRVTVGYVAPTDVPSDSGEKT